jgi:hypothetical protein
MQLIGSLHLWVLTVGLALSMAWRTRKMKDGQQLRARLHMLSVSLDKAGVCCKRSKKGNKGGRIQPNCSEAVRTIAVSTIA